MTLPYEVSKQLDKPKFETISKKAHAGGVSFFITF